MSTTPTDWANPQRDYPCPRCNMDEGSPICLQDERCTGQMLMTVDDFFAEARRLNMRMVGTPEETRAALDLKDAEIERLRNALLLIHGQGDKCASDIHEARAIARDALKA